MWADNKGETMTTKIVVDSTACIDQKYAEENNIEIVSLSLNYEDVNILEKDVTDYDSICEKMAQGVVVKTSQPSYETYKEVLEKAIKEYDDVIVLTISEALSGTFQCVSLVKRDIGSDKIHIVDSGQTGSGIYLIVKEMVQRIKAGDSGMELLDKLPAILLRTNTYFVPASLKFLQRGGRINLISAALGTLLQMKPILNFRAGVLKCAKKAFGMQKAICEMVSMIPDKIKSLIYLNIKGKEALTNLKKRVEARFGIRDFETSEVSLVVSSHIGPGTVGVAYMEE